MPDREGGAPARALRDYVQHLVTKKHRLSRRHKQDKKAPIVRAGRPLGTMGIETFPEGRHPPRDLRHQARPPNSQACVVGVCDRGKHTAVVAEGGTSAFDWVHRTTCRPRGRRSTEVARTYAVACVYDKPPFLPWPNQARRG